MQNKDGNLVFKTSHLQHLHLIITGLGFFALSVYGDIYWPWSLIAIEVDSFNLALSVFLLPGVLLFVTVFFRSHNERLILTDDYVLFVQGIMQWKQNSVRMEYPSIKEVCIDETIFQRILGLGDIRCITVVSGTQPHVTMEGLKNPRHVKDLILERIRS